MRPLLLALRTNGHSQRGCAAHLDSAAWIVNWLIDTCRGGVGDTSEKKCLFPTKAPREKIVLLQIRAAPCPLVLDRLLSFLTSTAFVPVDVMLEQDRRTTAIEIALDCTHFFPSRWLLEQLEELPSVRSAELLDCAHRSIGVDEIAVGQRTG